MIEITPAFREAYPEASAGILVIRNVDSPGSSPALDQQKKELESAIREQFDGADRETIKSLETIKAYSNYYKRFRKTYHIQLQLESIAFKGKSIPRVAPVVEAMFMAELKNQLLTAGHDLAKVDQPIRLDVATGKETYATMNGREQQLKPDDMLFADEAGVLSSIIYGPDQRTKLDATSADVLFTTYAPEGISEAVLEQHLEDIVGYVHIASPAAEVEVRAILRP